MLMTRIFLWLFLFALLVACSGGGGEDVCEDVTCSGHGTCTVSDGAALCDCDEGFRVDSAGTGCVLDVDDPCRDITCSGLGRCRVDGENNPYCECQGGTYPTSDGLDCVTASCTEDCGDMGCCGDHCCVVRPSNATSLGRIESTGLNPSPSGTFDTDTDCNAGSALGDCELIEAVSVCVCRVDSLQVGGSLRLVGSAALAVLASDSISISGTLDMSAHGDVGGAGARVQAVGAGTWYGGRGGSCGTAGGSSGEAPGCAADMQPLVGGQFGQNGCGDQAGGGSGGGVQLSAVTRVTISGTILANGAGGQGGQGLDDELCIGGAGGGSGGTIVLEAREVVVTGAIWANGGGGGGGGNNHGASGGDGADATASMNSAIGGAGRDGLGCALYEDIEGGEGGSGAAGTSQASDGESYDHNMCMLEPQPYVGGGGGGGGFGRIRINTLDSCDCASGTFSPAPGEGFLQKD